MENRIGSRCWYKVVVKVLNSMHAEWRKGVLRAWGTDYEEFETGPGLYPIAVIEDEETQCCKSISVDRVCFAAVPPELKG